MHIYPLSCFTHHAHKALDMPLLIQSLKCPVSDWLLTPPALGQDSVCIAVVTVWLAILLPVGHAA